MAGLVNSYIKRMRQIASILRMMGEDCHGRYKYGNRKNLE
jgi:hypothetical protein